MDRQAVGAVFRPAAQSVQQGGGGGETVALLDAEPGGVDKPCGALPDGGHYRQGRQQVRAAGHVDVHIAGLRQLPVEGGHHPVTLGRGGVQALNGDAVVQEVGGVPEACLGPVGFHGDVPGGVGLLTGDTEDRIVLVFHSDAELFQHIQCHVHISAGLQRRGNFNGGISRQQGQGVQQSRDELAGHITGKMVHAGSQRPLDGEHAVLLLIKNALFIKNIKIRLLRAFHQAAMPGEYTAACHRQRDGDEKAEGGAGFAAVQEGKLPVGAGGFQGFHTAFRGLNVLRVAEI